MSDRVARHRDLCTELNVLYARWGSYYENRFRQSQDEDQMILAHIRIGALYSQFRAQTNWSESARKILMDIANFALLSVLELEGEENGDGDIQEVAETAE